VTDRKPVDFRPGGDGREVPANQPIHDLGVRLVFDATFLVHEVSTFSVAFPYAECPGGGAALQSLKGLRMTAGWGKAVRDRLRGARSCTHLMELLSPMATAAFQSMSTTRRVQDLPEALDADGRPLKIDSCYAYAAGGELVRRRWPQFAIARHEDIHEPRVE